MFAFYIITAFAIFLLLSPIIFASFLVYLGATGFTNLGFSLFGAFFVLMLMLFGSFINIPLSRKRMVRVIEPSFFGVMRRYVWRSQGVSLNLGGAVIPLVIVTFITLQVPLSPVIISTAVVAFVAFISSRFIPGVGVVASALLPVLFATITSLVLSPEHAAETAFSSGVLGVLIGADLLRLPVIMRRSGGVISIGGAGVFDGIFIVGIVSAILASI